jgi:tricorn protease
MPTPGYYRFPTVHKDSVVFVSEDDLWSVPTTGGIARRLTSNLAAISFPAFSPDGQTLAFTGREEGHNEVYVMPAEGGPVTRLTYLGVLSNVLGWMPEGNKILFTTDHGQPLTGIGYVHTITPEGGIPERLPVGHAVSISVTSGNRTVLGRNNNDPARWKRYRGGTAGDLWVDAEGKGEFRRLIQLKGNVARPMWVGDRIFFLSDHESVANIYSCTPEGTDLQRHTHHTEFFARFPSTDGTRLVYHAGADLYLYDPTTGEGRTIDIRFHSPRVARQRKFVEAARYLDSYSPHPLGHSIAVTTRGKSFTFGNFEGPVLAQGGENSPIRYRLTSYLNDGDRVVTLTDDGGEEAIQIHSLKEDAPPVRLDGLDIGRPYTLRVSPTADHLILHNHRHEVIFVDLVEKTLKVVDRSPYRMINGIDWSPDGRYVAYGFGDTARTSVIKLWDRTTGETHAITNPVLQDGGVAFDPEGKYLYFLSARVFNPVYDGLHFDLGFPKGERPYLITLKAETPSPFLPQPHILDDAAHSADLVAEVKAEVTVKEKTAKTVDPVQIDLEGIQNRVIAFPVSEGRFGQIAGIRGKALFSRFEPEGALDSGSGDSPKGVIEIYDFKELKHESLIRGISDFQLSRDNKSLYYRAGNRLRIVRAGEKPPDKEKGNEPGRKSGWVDLGRIKVSIEPGTEWRQMAQEAWRLQREHFWTPNMSNIDWNAVWERYKPLLERVGTRGEFSDLMWEMQGELGTSHAYEGGGDYRTEPSYPIGFLGADYAFDETTGNYCITHLVQGEPGDIRANSPLLGPGINVREGDRIRAINGRRVSKELTPNHLLVHLAESEVTVTVENSEGKVRDVIVKTLRSEFPARYREWVDGNRRLVHEATGGRVGYIHIPDMGANGYAEFHRTFLVEAGYDGLIVDVRYNRGGHVSQLLLEKLARRRVGYDIQRWGQPEPYPELSIPGPIVALTNQFAGSDGDIFSHVFKLRKLGPLIGKRTWGGVIGIWPRNRLADGSTTTQPEFSFWFEDVGWGVENYGTDPDIDIDIAPQDYGRGYDPQMEKALALVQEMLEQNPPVKPDFTNRPNLSPPPLIPG